MKAHVLQGGILTDPPMLGEMVTRLVHEKDVELFVVNRRAGESFVAGFGPIELELTLGSQAELSILGVELEGSS